MKIHWYPWLTNLYKKILLSYQIGKGHHALLLHSNQGNGQDVLIYAISRWLMCKNPNGIKCCRTCRNCILMKSNCHPDYHVIAPDKGNAHIGIENVRVLIEMLRRCAFQDGVKIISLMHSELLTEAAVNALLKILEEPPDNTYFILGCYSYLRLLPTLLSRCCYWSLTSPQETVGLDWLKKHGIKNILHASSALRLCNGAPLAAQCLLESKCWQLRLHLCALMLDVVVKSNFFDLLPLLCNQNNDNVLCWLISLLIDALKWQLGMKNLLINIDQKKLISCIAVNWTTKILHDQLKGWIQCRYYLHNINGINKELLLLHQLFNCMQSN
ncbi:DNA polymerase III subunit delta' [Blochmannia endosymbiont of Camponotus (Colobopsis) obliquus]|nr:DNA polymerase III subunit delta' [Blochmannia endosymbiont of Camponotus (Colobopsis) obliquus]